jgi:acyl-CoA dehydrogenase
MGKLFDEWRSRSPYYDESHEAVAQSVRRFIAAEATPNIEAWETARMIPAEFHRKAGEAGLLGLGLPEEYGGTSEGIDSFHLMVQGEEIATPGAGGLYSALNTHMVALPPVLLLGSDEMKRRIAPEVISGRKVMALAITEPSGGSDVARLRTRAERRGDHYVVNGSKTFISSGMRADYFTVAVRTGGPGLEGISLMLLEKEMRGLSRTPLEKMGWHCGDTATLYFDNVEVPAENLIGPENQGFLRILENFNSERLNAAHQCCAYARVCLEEAAAWAAERETFGKKLGQHQVIRSKLADMARLIDATQAYVDLSAWRFTRQLTRPADFALLKVQATRTFEQVAREAAQVLGGASFIRGNKVERIYREVRVMAIGGGSEEILLDLAGRQLGFG